MRRSVFVLAFLAAVAATGAWAGQTAISPDGKHPPAATEQSPFVGSWVANVAKSKRDPNHQFQSATLQFAVSGDTVTLTQGGVNAGGQAESSTITIEADGKERPIPQAPGVVSLARWVGPRVLEMLGKKDGQVVGRGRYEVSADGQTLTASVMGTDASGAAFEQVIVFDRK
jgi:hypothetical protein